MKWALGLYVLGMAWVWWEIRHPATVLPYSRLCAWCGAYATDLDRELHRDGATVTHTICQQCEYSLDSELYPED